MNVDLSLDGLEPFITAIKELLKQKKSIFFGKDVDAAFVILTFKDGGVNRAGMAMVNVNSVDYGVAIQALEETRASELQYLERPNGRENIN